MAQVNGNGVSNGTDNKYKLTLERTLIIIKPDAVQRGFIGKIIKRFEEKGLKLVAIKMVIASEEQISRHYENAKDKPFYNKLINYMQKGPIVPMVWEGLNAIQSAIILKGSLTPGGVNPPGTIRGDFSLHVPNASKELKAQYLNLNYMMVHGLVCHSSDSVEEANEEIAIWFKKDDIVDYYSATDKILYEF